MSYAPKTATATRHEMPVIVPLVTVLLRLLHGLVIVLLLVARDDGLRRDRGRLLAARVHLAHNGMYAGGIRGRAITLLEPRTPHTPIYRLSHRYHALPDRSRHSRGKTRRKQIITILRAMRAVNIWLPTARRANSPSRRAGVALRFSLQLSLG